ncbi:hypothetical protein O181_061999 [Austropuccinia psidii MF-1]|uniref:Uncharacterized protein n=1 Tax=Austropuccinia psidii MF-1 TaxID=1389203 RepID=A0A9Q3EJA4_9BASI|nr:hypothetical protein [Austropuccinia psidii MF-1]
MNWLLHPLISSASCKFSDFGKDMLVSLPPHLPHNPSLCFHNPIQSSPNLKMLELQKFSLDVLPPPRTASWPSPILMLLHSHLILSTTYHANAPTVPINPYACPGSPPFTCKTLFMSSIPAFHMQFLSLVQYPCSSHKIACAYLVYQHFTRRSLCFSSIVHVIHQYLQI